MTQRRIRDQATIIRLRGDNRPTFHEDDNRWLSLSSVRILGRRLTAITRKDQPHRRPKCPFDLAAGHVRQERQL